MRGGPIILSSTNLSLTRKERIKQEGESWVRDLVGVEDVVYGMGRFITS